METTLQVVSYNMIESNIGLIITIWLKNKFLTPLFVLELGGSTRTLANDPGQYQIKIIMDYEITTLNKVTMIKLK